MRFQIRLSGLLVAAATWVAVLSSTTRAASEIPLAATYDVEGVTYSTSVPKPEDVIGHRVGTRHTRAHQLVDYFRALARASDRVTVADHGRSYEGRPLIHAIVTSVENHRRLEEIRLANLRLSDQPNQVSDSDLAGMPAVVYLGYSVHGNEASGSEASLLTLYHLAAGQGPPVEEVLKNVVVLIDPSLNPDGRDRFVNWANGNRGAVATTDSQDREHNEPWPGGRTNHYWFDLNRDWLPAQLPESQGRLQLFHHWRPQMQTDHHEMGSDSSFFFMPGIPSHNNPNTPQRTFELTAEIARYHAEALDRIGSLYYSEETYDDFYYGKGSTYPDVNGAIGILFEQASSRSLRRSTGSGILDYAFTIRNHFSASLSSLRAAVEMRGKLLRHQRDFYREAPQAAARNPVKAYLLDFDGPARTQGQSLSQMLRRHRIRVHLLSRDIEADGHVFRAGRAYIVPVDQPQTRLLKTLMEKVTQFEDVLFYDVSAWTMPLAFGVPYAELPDAPDDAWGAPLDSIEPDGGRVAGGQSEYAYIMEWGGYFAPRALYRLLDAGVSPRLALEPFEIEADGELRRFEAGSVVVPVVQRDSRSDLTGAAVHRLVEQAAVESHAVFYRVDGGLTPSGPDLGGASLRTLEKPRVAILSGPGTNGYQVGATWHLLNERMQMPVSLLDAADVEGADLSRYTVLVMPGGGYGGLDAEKIKSWVSSGGTLIAMQQAARWVLEKKLIAEKLQEEPKKDEAKKEQEAKPETVPYGDVRLHRGAQIIGGAIFEVSLDPTHPLAFGHPERMAVFRNHTNFFQPSTEPGANVALYTDEPRLSGYVSDQNLKRLAGTAALIARRSGRGRVVLFVDDPNFRAFWYGTHGLFLNAVFFGGVF